MELKINAEELEIIIEALQEEAELSSINCSDARTQIVVELLRRAVAMRNGK